MTITATEQATPVAIVCGGGNLPYTVADAALRGGRKIFLFPLRGFADAARVGAYPHYWGRLGQFGAFCRIARAQGCRDVVFIGSLVRPTIWQLRFDLATLRILPSLLASFRGGDNHLLSSIGAIFEREGFRLVGAHEIAPEILVPSGPLGALRPDDNESADIRRGLALLSATSPFDVGQAVVIANNNVLAVEAAEGTDRMLERVAMLRGEGRIRPAHGGVLVKAPKHQQDHRYDLPSIGPRTVGLAADAGLDGIAVTAGSAIVAEPQELAMLADRRKLFVVGIDGKAAS
jgi:DUF1009 family protein